MKRIKDMSNEEEFGAISHYCFFGDEFSDKYEKAKRYIELLTNEDLKNSNINDLNIYTSETRKYVIKVLQTSLSLSYTFLNPISYDTQIIKTILHSISKLNVIDSILNKNVYRVLLLNNIEFLSINAIKILCKEMQQHKIIIVTTSNTRSYDNTFSTHGIYYPCKNKNELIDRFENLSTEPIVETWKVVTEKIILDILCKKPTVTEFEKIKVTMLDLWVSNITFISLSKHLIRVLSPLIDFDKMQSIVQLCCDLDHDLTNPHYHMIFYFTKLLTHLITTIHSC